jgi:hypothetical protein
MESKTYDASGSERRKWMTPSLEYRGTVGELLQTGGGKLSLAGADPGEMRCEKPHKDQCNQPSQG